MRLRYKSFKLCTDVLKFVEDEKIDINDIINISSMKGRATSWHYLWWKEEETSDIVEIDRASLENIEALLRNTLLYLDKSWVYDATRCAKGALNRIQEKLNDI